MNPLLFAAIGSLLRFLFGGIFGYLVAKGVWTDTEAASYLSAAVVAVLTLGWSIWSKYKGRLTLLTALASNKPRTENDVKFLVKEGLAPPVGVGPDTIPRLTGPVPEATGASRSPYDDK